MVSIRQLEERRARYAEWFAALGLDPDTMPMDAMNSFTISRPEGSTPTVTAEVYETNDGGTVRHPLVRSRRTIPLTVEPPDDELTDRLHDLGKRQSGQ